MRAKTDEFKRRDVKPFLCRPLFIFMVISTPPCCQLEDMHEDRRHDGRGGRGPGAGAHGDAAHTGHDEG